MSERSAEKAPPTARPSGALYRPRKPLRAECCMWNDDSTAVLVYGTHDADLARPLAEAEWGMEGPGYEMPNPTPIWVKKVPWDALGLGYDSTVMEVGGDTKGSTPVLRYGGDRV